MKLINFLFGEMCTVCNKTRTHRKDAEGNLICYDCRLEKKIKEENKLCCPKCYAPMNKEYIEKTIIDKCPDCGGVFLDSGEMFGFLHDTLTPRGA